MTIVNTGFGILAHKTEHYIDQQRISSILLSVDIRAIIQGLMVELNSSDNQVLVTDSLGNLRFKKIPDPVSDDEALRKEYPSLQLAWDKLLEAVSEYEVIKKLVQEHSDEK